MHLSPLQEPDALLGLPDILETRVVNDVAAEKAPKIASGTTCRQSCDQHNGLQGSELRVCRNGAPKAAAQWQKLPGSVHTEKS